MKMKKTVLKVVGRRDEFWCSQSGNALEVMSAHLVALQTTIEIMEKETASRGPQFLEMLLEDIEKLFAEHGIKTKNKKVEND